VESIFGLAFSIVVFIVWWLAIPRYGHMMFGPLAQELSLNPALRAYYLTMLVPTLVITVQQCSNLFRPQWTLLRSICMLAADAISLGIIESLMKIHPYVIWAHEAAIQANVLFIINQVIQWSVLGVALGIFIGLVVHAFQTVQAVPADTGTAPSFSPANFTATVMVLSLRKGLLEMFNQIANLHGIAFCVAMAHNRIGAAGRINAYIGPEYPRADLHRRHLGNRDTFLRAAEQFGFDAQHTLRIDLNPGGKEKITARPMAGDEDPGGI